MEALHVVLGTEGHTPDCRVPLDKKGDEMRLPGFLKAAQSVWHAKKPTAILCGSSVMVVEKRVLKLQERDCSCDPS